MTIVNASVGIPSFVSKPVITCMTSAEKVLRNQNKSPPVGPNKIVLAISTPSQSSTFSNQNFITLTIPNVKNNIKTSYGCRKAAKSTLLIPSLYKKNCKTS